jgi:hypothetical protein
MFGFMKKNDNKIELTLVECKSYLSILNKLQQILKAANLGGQALVIQSLMDLILRENIRQFVKLINSIDMWGGSGAVWEVYIENKAEARVFEKEMINLINLMEATNILGGGIKPIKKIFMDNMKSQ